MNPEEILCACVLKYMLESRESAPYRDIDAIDETNRQILNDTLGRISALMDGGTRISNILLYCPTGSSSRVTNNSWASLSQKLLLNQLDYLAADFDEITSAEIANGCVKFADNEFRYLVLPCCGINKNMLDVIARLEKENIIVLIVIDPLFANEVKKMMIYKNVKVCKDERELLMYLSAIGGSDIFFKREMEVVYMKKVNHSGENYLFVNTKNEYEKSEIEITTDKRKVSLYNPVTDENLPLESSYGKDKISFELEFPPYGFHIVCAE